MNTSRTFSPRCAAARRVSTLLVALVGFFVVAVATGPALADDDLWYVLELGGKRAGYVHSSTKTEGDQITSVTEMHFSAARGPSTIEVLMKTSFVETKDGKPVSMTVTQNMARVATETSYAFGPNDVTVTSKQFGAAQTTTKPLPAGEWLPPAAAQRYVTQQLAAGAKQITYRTMNGESGLKPTQITDTGIEKTTAQALGRSVPAMKWTSSTDAAPTIKAVEEVDAQGRPIRSDVDMGLMKMTVVLADKDLALSKVDAPELLVASFITPDKPIEHARQVKHGVYTLSVPAGVEMPELPSVAGQTFKRVDASTAQLTEDAADSPASDEDVENPAFRTATRMLDCNDPMVKKLADASIAKLPKDATDRQKAEALRQAVYTYINTKDFDVGFASASETVRTREGDCSEHGTLLAALLRAEGIPARVTCGLEYADLKQGGIFGYHMWTQAIITENGSAKWVNFDSTLPTPLCDATHLLLGVSALRDDDTQNLLVAMAPLMGQLKIHVEEAK